MEEKEEEPGDGGIQVMYAVRFPHKYPMEEVTELQRFLPALYQSVSSVGVWQSPQP